MAQTIPLYFHAPATPRDDPAGSQFPQSADRFSLASTVGAAEVHASNRFSFRPTLPPKPAAMGRSQSADSASDTSTTVWMEGRGASPPLSVHAEEDDLQLPVRARTVGSARGSAASTPVLNTSSSITSPPRSSSHEPPAIPPRPVNLSSPAPPIVVAAFDPQPSPSSCPPSLSPFGAMSAGQLPSSASFSIPTVTTTASRSPDRWRSRPPQHPSISSSASLTSSASSPSLNPAGTAFGALGRGLGQAKFKDRFGAGVGLAREWGGKGKGKLQDSWRGFQTHRSAISASDASAECGLTASASGATLDSLSTPSMSTPQLESHLAATSGGGGGGGAGGGGAATIRLPTMILGVRVPNVRGQAFGSALAPLVERTRAPPPGGGVHVARSADEVTGDEARFWLPGVAFRALEYLEEWGRKEEGIYRVPGRSHMVAQLRAMYDAGVGQEKDLREIHPADLDPHAVASMLKGWLREIPEPLLSHQLEVSIDALTAAALGYPASSSHFLSGASTIPAKTPAPTPGGPSVASGTSDSRAPREYLEQLRELFASAMPPENYYLLRAVAYHLARLAAHESTNKMSLNNLRLIFPTLRLSPGFLQVLVVEREILFSKANEAGRIRQASASSLSSPPLASASAFRTRSPSPQHPPRRSPTPGTSPLLNPPSPHMSASNGLAPSSSSLSRGSGSGGSWLVVDEPAFSEPSSSAAVSLPPAMNEERLSPAPSPSSSPGDRPAQQTPIADRFASSSAPPPLPLRSRSASSTAASTAPTIAAAGKPFIPTRDLANGAGGSGFFSSHAPVAPAVRKSPSPSSALASPAATNHPADARLSLGAEFRAALAGLDAPVAAAARAPLADPARASAGSAPRPGPLPPRCARTGIGLGLGAPPGEEGAGARRAREENDEWALLSVEERTRFFGG
ncbi:hypothetical protein JCM3770_000969 [Rhodotorula araucariae]